MDNTVGLPKINLLAARVSRVRAEIGEHSEASGGTLSVKVNRKLAKNEEPNQATGQVVMAITAFPKGAQSKGKAFVFKVDLAVDGVFGWKKGYEPNLDDEAVEIALLQSLYFMAVNEVVGIAHKLGFAGVEIPLDLKINNELAEKARNATEEKAPKRRTSARAAASTK